MHSFEFGMIFVFRCTMKTDTSLNRQQAASSRCFSYGWLNFPRIQWAVIHFLLNSPEISCWVRGREQQQEISGVLNKNQQGRYLSCDRFGVWSVRYESQFHVIGLGRDQLGIRVHVNRPVTMSDKCGYSCHAPWLLATCIQHVIHVTRERVPVIRRARPDSLPW